MWYLSRKSEQYAMVDDTTAAKILAKFPSKSKIVPMFNGVEVTTHYLKLDKPQVMAFSTSGFNMQIILHDNDSLHPAS